MELKGDLQVLIERAWALHDGLADEIKNSNNSFCTFSSGNGRFCNISETSFQEKQRLIAIRDSLKDVADVLMLVQRLRSWQLIDRDAALARLEESRTVLVKKVKEYRGRSVGAVNELNSIFNNGNSAFDWNMKKDAEAEKENKKRSGFIICWIRMVLDPWKWQKAFVVAAKLVVVSASISSAVGLCHANSQPRKQTPSDNSPWDVCSGRG